MSLYARCVKGKLGALWGFDGQTGGQTRENGDRVVF